jgi:hypothetical protein
MSMSAHATEGVCDGQVSGKQVGGQEVLKTGYGLRIG